MSLPSVDIDIVNGGLGQSVEVPDGVVGLLLNQEDSTKTASNVFTFSPLKLAPQVLSYWSGDATEKRGIYSTSSYMKLVATANAPKETQTTIAPTATKTVYIFGKLVNADGTVNNDNGKYYVSAVEVTLKFTSGALTAARKSQRILEVDTLAELEQDYSWTDITPTSANTTVGDLGGVASAFVRKSTPKKALITSLKDAETKLGISEALTPLAHSYIEDFYTGVGANTSIYVLIAETVVSGAELVSHTNGNIEALMALSKNKISLIGVNTRVPATGATRTDGLDSSLPAVVVAAQAAGEFYAAKNLPLRFVLDGANFSGVVSDLKDYKTDDKNKVAIVLGSNEGETNSLAALFLGQLAALPVYRKNSRVKNGSVPVSGDLFLASQKVEDYGAELDVIHDRGYILPRTFVEKSGYFWSSDTTLTGDADDFNSLARGRIIDKVQRLAVSTLINYLDDEIQTTGDGSIVSGVTTSLEQEVESAVTDQMPEAVDAITVYIDPKQKILKNSIFRATLQVQPVAYATNIKIELSFTNPNK